MPSVFARPNKFKGLSYSSILSADMGKLVPFYRQEVVPGDEFKVSADAMVRLAPMLAPIFGEINLWMHFFFVPNRTIWSNFEDFVTNGLENGTTNAVHPYITGVASTDQTDGYKWDIGSLADYLGVPVKDAAGANGASVTSAAGLNFNALPFRAYAKIWNDWYRNEFLENEVTVDTGDGQDTTTNLDLLNRSWKRDYFTSALPFRQLGTPVTLPLGTTAPVIGTGKAIGITDGTHNAGTTYATGTGLLTGGDSYGVAVGTTSTVDSTITSGKVVGLTTDGSKSGLVVDLSNATAATINDIRTAFQLQRIMERKARSGNRYVEYIASAFGVRSPDARLQRAEFLGGGRAPIMISEILQTSEGTQNSPQGNMSGHGFGASRTFAFNKAFTEHGWIIGILSVMPKAYYSQGIPRDLMKTTWTDYYQPELAHLGEQAIDATEVVGTATPGVWGYQPMYEHYRRRNSEVHGDFRTNLNYWTIAREFGTNSVPLNDEFVKCNPDKTRIFAAGAQADRPCWIQMHFNVQAIRCLPKHGNPGLVDH